MIPVEASSHKTSFAQEIPLCSICLEEMAHNIETVCKHHFHSHCLNEWLKTKDSCPMCRKVLKQAEPTPVPPLGEWSWWNQLMLTR